MKGLILAGGHGTRLRPLTFTGNKHMIPIANKPMILHGVEHLVNAGIKEIAVILGPIKEGVRDFLGDGSKLGLNITYIDQPEPKGLAHAVLMAQDFLARDPFIMYLGDNLIKQGVKPLIFSYYNENSDCVICATRVRNPSQYGVVEIDEYGKPVKLVEKPKQHITDYALAGVYLFSGSIFEAVKSIEPSWRGELEITDAIQYLLTRGKKISVNYVDGWWKDTGRPEDLLEANQLVLDELQPVVQGEIDPSGQLLGKVSIGKNSRIKKNTRIRGPAIIGDNCEIGPNVYIGPYTSVGDDTKILSGEVEGSIVMQEVIIDSNQRIVESIIGRRSKLGSASGVLPSGLRFVVGESTSCRV